MSLHHLQNITSSLSNTSKMPVLFLGHGSPMNAIEENEFVASFRKLGKELPTPNAILCISAHWETKGTFVTAMQHPPTIHDFGGFPKALFDVQYPAPGSPELAVETKKLVTQTEVGLDEKWGLDHGAWSVIKHLYPKADIPVIQMSIDYSKPAQYHYELAKEIQQLRHKGVLIVGSGNMVHNLRRIAWDKMNTGSYGFDWAIEANEKMKDFILNDNHKDLIHFNKQGSAFNMSIPTPEHYLPLIYTLALKDKNEEISIFNDQYVGGSLSMTSIKIA
ncbi:4,5-DOPA-extradiol-dioxygenase [Wenyingzhuangia marina]|uniref:4,5-DOPA dioxygenase extradiol n=1 Tax=Wenyingzhuangia marina TaxID=1195760 RepID=A0A1M5V307_9FLAO|nr:4,5-DOPA dioxygenase extradiol [Wenyingzhuangia marina]GGF74929.1 dioxygenase [Wenyingzhuangia marina]SHH69343.1 4,5-DOPA dioxygenase extradiol [Wenyingzhuangia marina]